MRLIYKQNSNLEILGHKSQQISIKENNDYNK